MNGWEAAGGAIGSVMQGGGTAALSQLQREYQDKSALTKATALESLRQKNNRSNIEYQNTLAVGRDKVKSDSALELAGKKHEWAMEERKPDFTTSQKDFQAYQQMPDGPAKEQFGRKIGLFEKGGNSKSQLEAGEKLRAGYDSFLQTYDSGATPGKFGFGATKGTPAPSYNQWVSTVGAKEYPVEYSLYYGKGGSANEGAPAGNNTSGNNEVQKAVELIKSGTRTFADLEKSLGKTRPDLVESVRSAIGEKKPTINEMIKKSSEKSNPQKWNTVLGGWVDGALNLQGDPISAAGKLIGKTAGAAAETTASVLSKLPKWGKAAFEGLSDAGQALVAANKELSDKLTTVTTEEDAKKIKAEIMKIVNAKSYDYGTGHNEGDVLEPKPL